MTKNPNHAEQPSSNQHPMMQGSFFRFWIEPRWADMDAYGHINNVAQVRLIEEARVRALGSPTADKDPQLPGFTTHQFSGNHREFPQVLARASATTELLVARQKIRYRRPLQYVPFPLAIDICISRITSVSIDIGYAILMPGAGGTPSPDQHAAAEITRGDIATVAETEMVFADKRTGRPRRLTSAETQAFEEILAKPLPV